MGVTLTKTCGPQVTIQGDGFGGWKEAGPHNAAAGQLASWIGTRPTPAEAEALGESAQKVRMAGPAFTSCI